MTSPIQTATRHLLIAFLSGCSFKAIWILLWQWSRLDALLAAIQFWDHGPYQFAEFFTSLIFDQRRTLPGPAEAQWFDATLVIGSGLQWTLVGLVARAFIQRMRRT